MRKSHDRLHIALLSAFLCVCIVSIVLVLVNRGNSEKSLVPQADMSDAATRRVSLITKSLEGESIDIKHAAKTNSSNARTTFIIMYSDQDCGTCLNEMVDLINLITLESKSPIFSVNRSGEKQLPVQNLIYVDREIIKRESQLNNVPTPVLLFLNDQKEIIKAHVSTLFDDRDREKDFVDFIRQF